MKKSLILLFILLIYVVSAKIASAADFDYASKPIPQILRANSNISETLNIKPYKDINEKLYSIVGKTQLIKFDEPVKRISITDPSMADIVLLSPNQLLLNGKKAGRTSLVFWGDSDKPVFFNLVVQLDTDAVIQAINQIAPNEDVSYNFTDDGLILSGHLTSSNIKKNIQDTVKAYNIKLLDLTESPTKQVLLDVKITEASRTFTKSLASQFGIGQDAAAQSGIPLGAIKDGGAAAFKAGVGNYLFSSPSANIAWALSAGETKGLVKILAEPKLLAIDGKEGSFNVGQQIPYPSSVGLSSTTSYSFKDTGVILHFTPTIMEKSNRVMLKLSPEITEVDQSYASSYGVPGFKTRKVDTTVELADGETLVIAGLLEHTTSSSDTKVPALGDIPGLGFLFSSLSRTKNEYEVVIFITPKIVEVDKNKTGLEL